MRFLGSQLQAGCERTFVLSLALSEAAAAPSVRRDAQGVPTEFRLLKPGPLRLTLDGRAVEGELDAEDLRAILDYHAMKGELIPIDCEHLLKMLADLKGVDEAALIRSAPLLGEQAAVGAVSLRAENGEIWARVEKLTARARELLSLGGDKAYFYFSPVFRGLSNGPLRVTSIALTNTPALNDLDALAATGERGARQPNQGEKTMKEKLLKLLALLGRSNDAALTAEGVSLEPVLELAAAELEAARARGTAFLGAMKDALALTEADTLESVPGKLLPILEKAKGDAAALSTLQGRVAELEGQAKDRLIGDLKAAGKLTEAMLPWAKTQDAAALTEWAKGAPVVVPNARVVPADARPADGSLALSEAAVTIARKCGLDPKKVAEANKPRV